MGRFGVTAGSNSAGIIRNLRASIPYRPQITPLSRLSGVTEGLNALFASDVEAAARIGDCSSARPAQA